MSARLTKRQIKNIINKSMFVVVSGILKRVIHPTRKPNDIALTVIDLIETDESENKILRFSDLFKAKVDAGIVTCNYCVWIYPNTNDKELMEMPATEFEFFELSNLLKLKQK